MPYASERLTQARVEAGFTRNELALKLGKSESHVRNVENGQGPMLDVYLSRAAKILSVPFADLLADPPDQPRKKSEAAA